MNEKNIEEFKNEILNTIISDSDFKIKNSENKQLYNKVLKNLEKINGQYYLMDSNLNDNDIDMLNSIQEKCKKVYNIDDRTTFPEYLEISWKIVQELNKLPLKLFNTKSLYVYRAIKDGIKKEMNNLYLDYISSIAAIGSKKADRLNLSHDSNNKSNVEIAEIQEEKEMKGINRIYYGAPGTGKSYKASKEFPQYERITFHSEFTYFDFIGGLRPVVSEISFNFNNNEIKLFEYINQLNESEDIDTLKENLKSKLYELGFNKNNGLVHSLLASKFPKKENDLLFDKNNQMWNVMDTVYLTNGYMKYNLKNSDFSYDFVPGPFTNILVKAYNNPDEDVGLIIEEINRANTAAVFGDIFQLLDRKDGKSEYPISNVDLIKHLKKGMDLDNLPNDLKKDLNQGKIRIPPNFSLIATMNSADQGVFIMDSAFKRRWEFEYVPIDLNSCTYKDNIIEGLDVTWGKFCSELNDQLAELDINEDKHLGPFFLKEEELSDLNKVASKLLIYLWDDVLRYQRDKLFKDSKQFSKVVNGFRNSKQIFIDSFHEKLYGSKDENQTEDLEE